MRSLHALLPIASALVLTGCPSEKPKAAANSAASHSDPAAAKGTDVNQSSKPEPGDLPAPSDVGAAPADAEKTPSGLASKVIKKGTGTEHPEVQDTVKVHYTGWMTSGKMFDSSVKRGQPTEFPLNRVIACWTEGVQRMKVGGKASLTCPPAIAYGERGAGNVIPPNATLLFEVELLAIAGR